MGKIEGGGGEEKKLNSVYARRKPEWAKGAKCF